MSSETLIVVGYLVATALLIAGNALFVFHEFAFVRLRPQQVHQAEASGGKIDRLVVKMARRLDHYIAVDQLGITITSIAIGWIGQPVIADLLRDLLATAGVALSGGMLTTISFAIAFALVTAAQMIAGELIPKTVALRSPERVAALVALPVEATAWVMHPLVVVLNGAGNLVVRLLGVDPQAESHAQVLPPEELEAVIRSSVRAGLVPVDPTIIRQALHFSDLRASDLIVPRQEMVTLDVSMTADEVIEGAREHRFTRYPVVDGDIDRIAGILNVKDLFEIQQDGITRTATDWQRHIQPPLVLPETASIETVLQAVVQEDQHVVLLADEFGGITGMFTISDISRMITGSTEDIVEISDGVYTIEGETAVSVVETVLDISLGPDDSERDYDTIAGLIMARLGRIPEPGDEITVDGHELHVTRMQGFRITEVTLQIDAPRQGDDSATELFTR